LVLPHIRYGLECFAALELEHTLRTPFTLTSSEDRV
jgi:hypothetical protein